MISDKFFSILIFLFHLLFHNSLFVLWILWFTSLFENSLKKTCLFCFLLIHLFLAREWPFFSFFLPFFFLFFSVDCSTAFICLSWFHFLIIDFGASLFRNIFLICFRNLVCRFIFSGKFLCFLLCLPLLFLSFSVIPLLSLSCGLLFFYLVSVAPSPEPADISELWASDSQW